MEKLAERLRAVENQLRARGEIRAAEDIYLANARIALLERELQKEKNNEKAVSGPNPGVSLLRPLRGQVDD